MNGVRSIFRRKGYLLTALAVAVLLAASSGTAYAQATITAAKTVNEGDSATVTVTLKGFIEAAEDVNTPNGAETATVTATIGVGTETTTATEGEADGLGVDISTGLGLVATFMIPANATLNRASYSATRTIRVQTLHDLDAEDEIFDWSFILAAGGLVDSADAEIGVAEGRPTTLTIEDDEDQEYNLTADDDGDAKEGGDDITVTVTANPAHVNGSATLALQLDAPRSIASLTGLTDNTLEAIDSTARMRTATITLGGNDKNRDEDTITVSVHSGSAGNSTLVDSLSIDIEDKNALPAVTVMVVDEDGDALDPQPTSVKEGESVMVVVTVLDDKDKATDAAEDLEVALMPTGTADSADYILVGSSDIDMGDEMSAVIDIEVRSDEDVGMESLMFDAVVSGDSANGPGTRTSAAVLSLYIEDETAKKITPKASEADYAALMAAIAAGGGDDGVNPGDTVTVMTSDLFDVMDGYTASYGVSVEGDSASASASGDAVTINALMAGEAKVTVTGTARMASSSLIPTQTVSNVAELTFPVMVVDTELVVTVSADPMEIAEGGMSTITATANRYVTVGDGDVEIGLTVVGAGELAADSIMIAMGDMSGYTMLTDMADDDMDNSTLTVVATGSGIMGLMQVMITVMDDGTVVEPVPALPLVGQLLLALFMMVGGARLYRRRQG